MPTPALYTTQDALRGPLKINGGTDAVIIGVYGDSNAIGFDTSTTDWSPNVVDLPSTPTLGSVNASLWDKWTVGPNASRSSDADTGTAFRACDVGLFDHGAGTYLGGGQNARSNGPEAGIAHFLGQYITQLAEGTGNPTIYVVKYGVAGSVVHDAPVNPAAGWHPSGAATGCFNIYTTRYLRPAITFALAQGHTNLYWGGSFVVNLGGTDAIDPAGVFTDAGDAEQVGTNLESVVEGVHQFLGLDRPNVVYGLPPKTNENAAAAGGYPNMDLVREQGMAWAARRQAAGRRTAAVELAQFERISDYLHYSNKGQWLVGREMAWTAIRQGLRLQKLTVAP